MQGIERTLTDIVLALRSREDDVEVASLVYSSGWAGHASHPVQAIRIGRTVHLRGLLQKNAAWAVNDQMALIPDGFRPNPNMADSSIIVATAHNLTTFQASTLNIFTAIPSTGVAGSITSRVVGASTQWVSLYGISYQAE